MLDYINRVFISKLNGYFFFLVFFTSLPYNVVEDIIEGSYFWITEQGRYLLGKKH